MKSSPPYNQTSDCLPTLNDQQIIEFCRTGFLTLPAVVPEEINRKAVDFIETIDSSYEPTSIMAEEWFVEGILKNPEASGAVRSLLGKNFTLPVIISNHRGPLPFEGQKWHRDGGSLYTHKLEYLQVFYQPETCTQEMGPTEFLPGSHFLRTKAPLMAHYGKIAGTIFTPSQAGSITISVYCIWHRRSRATTGPQGSSRFRNLLKYNYWRTTPPKRDWITNSKIDLNQINFNPPKNYFEQFQGGIAAAKMFCWLGGIENEYENLGGQCWPNVPTVCNETNQVGIPSTLKNPSENQ